ncbi:MAG: hypothetical protein H6611_10380 [Ignavibacteriales bacterium]|nr:hypothetical protein [Ignavibacteriales bacterium]
MDTYKKKILLILMVVFLLFQCVSVSANILSEILSPFQSVDISQIYDSYSSIIDFIIYLILFTGLSQVSLGKRLESNGGKAVVIAIGLVLAVGLSISESYLGFNLRSFGPLAATIFIFLVGFVIFLGIKSSGMESVGAISISLVITYFSIRSVSPGFFDWMSNNQYMAWLHSVILIAVLISIYKIFKLFIKKTKDEESNNAKGFIKDSTSKASDFFSHLKDEKNETAFLRKNLDRISEESGKDSNQIIQDLQELKKLVKELGDSDKGKKLFSSKVSSLINKEKLIHQKFTSLKKLIEKVSKLDLEFFNGLQNNSKHLLKNDKSKFKEKIESEWKRIGVNKKITELEIAIKEYDRLFRHHLELLIISFKTNKQNNMIKQIDEAINVEKKIKLSFDQLLTLETQVKNIVQNF